jgi:hypothetical protein
VTALYGRPAAIRGIYAYTFESNSFGECEADFAPGAFEQLKALVGSPLDPNGGTIFVEGVGMRTSRWRISSNRGSCHVTIMKVTSARHGMRAG